MLVQAIIIAASAAFASAQVAYNSTTGQLICPASNPNGTFCAGESLSTNIIIRCVNGIGRLGNCNDNLAGYPPVGVNYAACWQTSTTSGDAACSKNCEVMCSSGGCGNGTITLPNCTPISSSASSAPTSTSSFSSTSPTSSTTTTSTGTTTIITGSTTTTQTFTTTFCPSSTQAATLATSIVTGTGSSSLPSNGTTNTGSATKTPTGPTTTSSTGSTFTGAANAYSPAVGGALAGIGMAVAYFL